MAYFAVNPNAQYIQAGLGAFVNAGRNTLRSNRISRTDAAITKRFPFGGDEGMYDVEIGAEINNLFNQRIFAIGLPTFLSRRPRARTSAAGASGTGRSPTAALYSG